MRRWLRLCAFLALCSGCEHILGIPPSQDPSDFHPLGRIDFRGFSAAFSEDRVVGPNVSLSRRNDGSWTGRIRDSVIDVNVRTDGVRGSGLLASWEESATGVTVHSECYGQILHLEVNDQIMKLRTSSGARELGRPVMVPGLGPVYNEGALPGSGPPSFRPTTSFTLQRLDREHFQGDFTLSGVASELHPPEPQFALAMIGAFD